MLNSGYTFGLQHVYGVDSCINDMVIAAVYMALNRTF